MDAKHGLLQEKKFEEYNNIIFIRNVVNDWGWKR